MRSSDEKKRRAEAAKAKADGTPKKQTTLLAFFEKVYLPEYMKDRKPSTRQVFCRTIERFIAFTRGDVPLADVTAETFKAYKDWHLECNRGAPATAYGDVLRIRKVLTAAGRCDLSTLRRRPDMLKRPNPEAPIDAPLEIEKFYADYYKVHRTVSSGYDQQITVTLASLRRFHKRAVKFDELQHVLSPWIAWLQERVAPRTVKSKRSAIITLWYAAFELGMCARPDTRMVRTPRFCRPAPDAWTLEEMQQLAEACKMFRGQFYSNGIDRGMFWEAFLRVCYDTALRRGDMIAIRRSQFEKVKGGHVLRTVQGKTGDGIVHSLRPATIEAVQAIISPDRDLIFEWPHTSWTLHNHWQDVLDRAGIDPMNRRNGIQKIRRTSASHLERIKPGSASAHLGHRSADMARLHYLDPKIHRGELPMPPAFDAAEGGAV